MNKKRIITSFLIASIIGVISFVSIFCGRRLFNYTGLTDAFFISGAIVVGIAGLIFTIRTGSFDVLNYGVYRLFESFKKGNEKKWDTALDYKNEQNIKREKNKIIYWPYFAVSGVFFILAIIFLVLFYLNIR